MMQSGPRSEINQNSKGVSYKQYNSPSSQDLKKQLFDHIDQLVRNHNVTVSSTMIKFTYNKEMKDHCVSSASGNDYDNKRHSISYTSSYSDTYNTKLSIGSQNHNKNFNNIVFIPKNVSSARKNGTTVINKKVNKGYKGLINEGNLYIAPNKKSSRESTQKVKNNSYKYIYNKEYQLNQLRDRLTKMNTSVTQGSTKSRGPVNHIMENCPNHQNNVANEVHTKKLSKNDIRKCLNESRDIHSSSNGKPHIKKNKIKLNISYGLEKERLKPVKSKDVNFKKKRSAASDEPHARGKKLKSDPGIPCTEAKEKESISKVKEKKVNVNHTAKKTPVKARNSSQVKYNSKRELLRDDPTLPPGWRRIIKGKHTGDEFKPVICIASPEGRKFYFKAKLQEYLKRTNSHLKIDDFHFGLYERGTKERSSKTVNADEKSVVKRAKKKIEAGLVGHEFKKIRLDKANNIKDNSLRRYSTIKDQLEKDDNETGNVNKNVLLVDPGLPPGWIRKVRIKNGVEGPDKFQVWVISPEGKKFRRKYLLQKYLLKTKSPLDINQFYFGLYPRKDGTRVPSPSDQSKAKRSKILVDLSHASENDIEKFVSIEGKKYRLAEVESSDGESVSGYLTEVRMSLVLTRLDDGENTSCEQPMLEDPTLPPGWRRYITIRSSEDNVGKMDVVIVSPDGRKHRSKDRLRNYIRENELDLTVDDFDFTVFGRNSKKNSSCVVTFSPAKAKPAGHIMRKRNLLLSSGISFSSLDLDHASVCDVAKHSREALMINYVSGMMLNCGLRDLRSERRQRVPKQEQEKLLKKYLESDDFKTVNDENEITMNWIQKLIHCRNDLGTLEKEAASTIASLTKDFLQEFTRHALEVSKNENSLEYGDLAEVVERSECLSPLKTLIPKKITYREFIRLNRTTKFSSFT